MKSDEIILTNYPFFKDLDHRYLERLAKNAAHAQFNADDAIIREGEHADTFYLILSGKINIMTDKLDVMTDTETQPIAIQTLAEGEILGWSWLIPPHKWRFTALAIEPTECIVLDGKYLREQCAIDHELSHELFSRLTHSMAQRLTATRIQLALHSGKPFREFEGE